MSPSQQKLMQYLPVVFAVFQVFFLLGLVIYYIMQAILRILQQGYITRRFYGHEESIGRQAQRAGERARELAEKDGGGGGLFAQAKRDLTRRVGNDDATEATSTEGSGGSAGSTSTGSAPTGGKSGGKVGSKGTGSAAGQKKSGGARSGGKSDGQRETPPATKRTTPPKNRPTPTNRAGRNKPNRPGGSSGRKR